MPSRRAIAALLAACAALLAACGPSADQQVSISGSVGVPAGLVSARQLTVAVPAGLPPYGRRTGAGNEGLAADLGQAMAQRMGIGVRFISIDSNAVASVAQSRSADVVIAATPLTRTTTPPPGYTLIPYVHASSELVVPEDSPFQPMQLGELCGHAVAVVTGTQEERLLDDAASQCGAAPPRALSVGSNDSAVAALRDGSADAYLADSATVAFDRATYGNLMTSSGAVDGVELALALRTDSPTVADALTRAYYTVRADGEYETLLEKWGMTADSL